MKVVLIILLALLIVLLLVLICLLIYPVTILVDSKKSKVGISWNRWLKATIGKSGENDIAINVLGWKKNYSLTDLAFSLGKKQKRISDRKRVRRKFHSGKSRFRVFGILKTIKLQELNLKLDTGDCIQNAYLFPIFQGIRWKTGHNIEINFIGINEIKLVLKVKLLRVLLMSTR